jgi:pimeloyl-ACP methyl ester carboxylesterase
MEICTHTLFLDGVGLVYHTAGKTDKPVLLFLHAWGIQVNWLPSVIAAFAKGFRVIAPEHPGLLRSSVLTDSSFVSYAAFYKKFLAQIGIEGPVIVVGSSFGGGIASMIAAQYPDLVRKLILVDSVLPEQSGVTWFVRFTHGMNKYLMTNPYVTPLTKKMVVWRALGVPWSQLSKDEIAKRVSLFTTPHPLHINYNLLRMPIICIWGTRDWFVHPIVHARAIAAESLNINFFEYSGSVPTLYKKPERVVLLIIKATC